jgi:hypothetical protein
MNIYFDKRLKASFIKSQKLAGDSSGYAVNVSNKERIIDEKGAFIKVKNLGGIRKGSKIFLSKDIDTVLREAALNKS